MDPNGGFPIRGEKKKTAPCANRGLWNDGTKFLSVRQRMARPWHLQHWAVANRKPLANCALSGLNFWSRATRCLTPEEAHYLGQFKTLSFKLAEPQKLQIVVTIEFATLVYISNNMSETSVGVIMIWHQASSGYHGSSQCSVRWKACASRCWYLKLLASKIHYHFASC